MAIRCGTVPTDLLSSGAASFTCPNVALTTPLEIITHAMNCDANGFSPSTRHNLIKNAVAAVVRRYNLAVVLEPLNYCSD